MKLSIVIVNYNVKYFLEQCLLSVHKAIQGTEAEVFVVDNNSVDGSMEMVEQKFPWVKAIINKDNVGFSKANNQAIRESSGEYVLLLNPDTVVEENTFTSTLNFMDTHTDAGALGVKMIDGKGNYLPESKRGLPTPSVAFYKISGLTSLFPRSKRFARYYMGHLAENGNHEVEILAGAFMLMRRSALEKAGLLDEDFFMYGEDIDLSYRIIKAGYKNYYFSDTSIIHYKGESTKKGSLNYVYVFYRAMVIFAEKHFSGSYAKLFGLFINIAIYLRAGLSLFKRFGRALAIPAVDALVLLGGLFYIKEYWEANHRFIQGGEYPTELIAVAFPLYTLSWILGVYFNNGYQRPTKPANIIRGVFIGSIVILVGYSLVSETYRFSRAIIVLCSVWAVIALLLWRWLFQKLSKQKLISTTTQDKRILIVGYEEEATRVESLVEQSLGKLAYKGFVSPKEIGSVSNDQFVGNLNQLPEIARVFGIDEVIFCSKDVASINIFRQMTLLNPIKVEIKIAPSQTDFVIGSNSIDAQGSWYSIQLNDLSKASNRRGKRGLDIGVSLLFILFSPLLLWFTDEKAGFYPNLFTVLFGNKTWVGYDTTVDYEHLPKLKPSVLKVTQGLQSQNGSKSALQHINQLYAKDYSVWNDFNFIISSFKHLGD